MIPKIFHYIWVGDKSFPEDMKKFYQLNESLHPDFEFKLWTNEDIDMSNLFLRAAYEHKAWAFLADYMRFQILYEYGGVYLDVDMEIYKNLTPLLDCSGFAGLNQAEDALYCGIIGAVPRNVLMKEVINEYDRMGFGVSLTSPVVLTKVYGKVLPGNFNIYSYVHFYPKEQGERSHRSEVTYTTHHWNESWRSFVPLRRLLRKMKIIKLIHYLGKKNENVGHYINTR